MAARAKAVTLLFAVALEPGADGGECRQVNALRHQQHSLTLDLGKFSQVLFDFFAVGGRIDDELKLIWVIADQLVDDEGRVACSFMTLVPASRSCSRGRGIREFRADRHEIAVDGQGEGPGGFHGNVPTCRMKLLTNRNLFGEEQRFASGKDDVPAVPGEHSVDDLLHRQIVALGGPRGVRGIAKGAAQVATRRTHENARRTRQQSFPLN